MPDTERHILTLMQRVRRSKTLDGSEQARTRNLKCSQCGLVINVDLDMSDRGDYFCDGSGELDYRGHSEDTPSILEVFSEEEPVQGEALLVLKRIRLQAQGLADSLEAYIYMYGKEDE